MVQHSPTGIVRKASGLSILWGVVLIILGALAVGSPFLAAAVVTTFLAWLIIFAGVAHLADAFRTHETGSLICRLLVGVAYIIFGIYLVAHPALRVASLTLLLAVLFIMEGIFDIAMYFRVRTVQRSGWILMDGIVTLFLGLMIYAQWPSSSVWAIGTLVGVSMIISGITRVMMSLAVRGAAEEISSKLAA
jgi:uncharacterized membrane protein HdeD (DUF308 family)